MNYLFSTFKNFFGLNNGKIFNEPPPYVDKNKPVKMTIIGNLTHLLVGSLFCSVPITYMCWLTLI